MTKYKLSTGESIEKTIIDFRVTKAKELKLQMFYDEHGYHFCEDCGINAQSAFKLDCSHNISVKKCQETGRSELAYSVNDMKSRCRDCHNIHDGTN